MTVKTSDYSFEKASYYAFRTPSVNEISTIAFSAVSGTAFLGLALSQGMAFSALNFTIYIMTSAALPLITLIGLRVLMGRFAEKSYNQAQTAKNTDEAFKLYKWAADHGQRDAPWSVGSMFQNGLGVAKDENQAYKYFALAILRGHEKSEELKTKFIEILSKKYPLYSNIKIEKFDDFTLLTTYTDSLGKTSTRKRSVDY